MEGHKDAGAGQPAAAIKDIPAPDTLAETNVLLRELPITLARILGMYAALVNPSHQWRDRRAQASAHARQIIDFAGLETGELLPDGDYVVRGGVIQPCHRHPLGDPAVSGLQEAPNA